MKIHEALAKILCEIDPISKNKKNKEQGFAFRGIDDVYNAAHPLFGKYGVFIRPFVVDITRAERITKSGSVLHHTTIKVKYVFTSSDGSELDCEVIGEAMDSGDKSLSKAMSIALKIAIFQMLLIPTEDSINDDPDLTTPPETVPTPQTVFVPDDIKKRIDSCNTVKDFENLKVDLSAEGHFKDRAVVEYITKVFYERGFKAADKSK